MDNSGLSKESLNILDTIKVKALDNILKRKTDLQPHQISKLNKHRTQTKRNINKRTIDIAQRNTPFKDLLKDYKLEEKKWKQYS